MNKLTECFIEESKEKGIISEEDMNILKRFMDGGTLEDGK